MSGPAKRGQETLSGSEADPAAAQFSWRFEAQLRCWTTHPDSPGACSEIYLIAMSSPTTNVTREVHVHIDRDGDVVVARQTGRDLAKHAGFGCTDQTLITTVISELARNVLLYAGRGKMALTLAEQDGRTGIVVTAIDEGPGIPDVARAMQDGYSTGNSLGLGLPGAKRLMDDFDLVSSPGAGTTITMKKWTA